MVTAAAHVEASKARSAAPLLTPALAACFLILAVPVLTMRLPPLGDYVNHLARMYVLAFGDEDRLLDGFYTTAWQILPNMGMDLVVPPLARHFDLYLAGSLFLLLCLASLLGGVHAVHYAYYRRRSLGPLVAGLFVYNQILELGAVNYIFGLGLTLWGAAAWMRMARWRPGLRAAAGAVFATLIFFAHLLALCLYLLTLVAFEAARFWSKPAPERQRHLKRRLAALAAPMAVSAALLAASPAIWLAEGAEWSLGAKAAGLLDAIGAYNLGIDVAITTLLGAAATFAWWRGALRIAPAALALVLLATPIYLALPTRLTGWGDIGAGLPLGILFLAVGLIDMKLEKPSVRVGFLAALAALMLTRVGLVEAAWLRRAPITADFRRSLPLIEPGSTVLVAEPDHPASSRAMRRMLASLPTLAMIERSSLVSTALSAPGAQSLRLRPDYRDLGSRDGRPVTLSALLAGTHGDFARAAERGAYWAGWPRNYDYLYFIDGARRPNPDPADLALLYRSRRFELYRIKHR